MQFRDQGKHKDATALLNDVLPMWEKTLGPEHPEVSFTINNFCDITAYSIYMILIG